MQIQYPRKFKHSGSAFLKNRAPKGLIVVNLILALVYFYVLTFLFPAGNKIIYGFLIVGEVFHLWQLFTFLYTIWESKEILPRKADYFPAVDVMITVAGEPASIIEETVIAAKNMDYPNFTIYILNDGYVAKRDNWREAEEIAEAHGVHVITRRKPGGAKAGNFNNGMLHSTSPFLVSLDADHVPHKDFLQVLMPYFSDAGVGFVQAPQYYKNYGENIVTSSAWEQQEVFYGAILNGKNRLNSASMCGTNMAIRRSALLEVGGMCEESIAEDFATGLFMHAKGWKSIYVPKIIAEGLAPEDFLSYHKQQFRWARGALDVLFKYNPLFLRGLSFPQRIQYLASSSFYLTGLVVVMNALIPIIFLFTGLVPVDVSTMLLAAIFLPYMFLTIYILQRVTNATFTFHSLAFTMGSFWIHIRAIWSAITRQKPAFDITPKEKVAGNYMRLARPHIVYIVMLIVGLIVGMTREGMTASLIANLAWATLNAAIFGEFIVASLPEKVAKSHMVSSSKMALPIPQLSDEPIVQDSFITKIKR